MRRHWRYEKEKKVYLTCVINLIALFLKSHGKSRSNLTTTPFCLKLAKLCRFNPCNSETIPILSTHSIYSEEYDKRDEFVTDVEDGYFAHKREYPDIHGYPGP